MVSAPRGLAMSSFTALNMKILFCLFNFSPSAQEAREAQGLREAESGQIWKALRTQSLAPSYTGGTLCPVLRRICRNCW